MDFTLEHLMVSNTFSKTKTLIDLKTDKFLKWFFKWRIISIIGLVFVSTFKSYTVGLDTLNYLDYFEKLKNNHDYLFVKPISSKYEISYTFLNSILAICGANYRILLLIISTFVSICIVKFINYISEDKQMSMILYITLGVFAQSLSANRQIIAMGLVLLALNLIFDKKIKQSIVIIIFASTFHISALCCLILVPIRYLKPKLWIVCTMFCIAIIGSLIFPYIMKVVEKLTPLDYYSRYFVNNTEYIVKSDIINILYSVGLLFVFIVFYFMRRYLILNEKKLNYYDFSLMIFLFVPLIRLAGFILNAQALFNRLSMYFFMVLIVLIPLFLEGLKYNKKIYMSSTLMVYVISFGYMYYLYAVKLSCGVVPYFIPVN